jgi:putative transcriptional regulator
MDSLKGKLLISSAGLYDDSFRHTVVLVGEHDAQGAVGVILNRPLEVTVEDAIPALGELGRRLFEGGPVDMDQAVILAQGPNVNLPVFDDVGFITGEVPDGIRRVRVFLGHAGWGPGQLDAEVAADAWILEDADEGDIFTDSPDTLWPDLLKRKGPPYDLMARIPFDPTMN